MDKLKLFLLFDGIVVVGGLCFFLFVFFRSKKQNQFRDDLWERSQNEKKKRSLEEQVDRKILEYRPEHSEAEEPLKKGPEAAKAEFNFPNFYGKPHEVLGVGVGANRDLVLRAHRHWMKRYHPDRVSHLGERYVEQARRRAEQLNTARDLLLREKKV